MRRLILCCDGTWNRADQATNGFLCPTNVLKQAIRVAKNDGQTAQIIYYDQGVGTGNSLDRITGGAFGRGLEENIWQAYRFLVANYECNDEIYLFGFSRGAFTVRSIAGMIRNCGILKRDCLMKYPCAVDMYRKRTVKDGTKQSSKPEKEREGGPDDEKAKKFRAENSICEDAETPIKFIGVWDTVGALGIPARGLRALTKAKYEFHDVELSGSVKNAFHALAIDERRAPFEPTLWEYHPKEDQTVEQTWFCGVHSDVGGGYLEHQLSDISLKWMLKRAARLGLVLDSAVDTKHPLDPKSDGTKHNSKEGLYWLTPGIDRSIGLKASSDKSKKNVQELDDRQFLHPSVMERFNSDKSYRPKNLVEYLLRTNNQPNVCESDDDFDMSGSAEGGVAVAAKDI